LAPGTLRDLRVTVAGLKFDGAEPNIQDFTPRVIITSSPRGCQGRADRGSTGGSIASGTSPPQTLPRSALPCVRFPFGSDTEGTPGLISLSL
jgi:hypothetical protein